MRKVSSAVFFLQQYSIMSLVIITSILQSGSAYAERLIFIVLFITAVKMNQ